MTPMLTTLRAAALATLVAAAACRGDHANGPAAASATGSRPASGAATAAPAPPSADRVCVPAMICLEWAGCALVASDGSGKGTVISADRLPPGQAVRLENGCNNGADCPAAKGVPPGVVCAPVEVPPILTPPGYTCVLDGDTCRRGP